MDIEQIYKIMAEPEKLIDPGKCNILAAYISGMISDLEEELNERNYAVSARWGDIRKKLSSDKKADKALELEDVYRDREKTKLLLAKLKRYRADVKDRFLVLTNQKRY